MAQFPAKLTFRPFICGLAPSMLAPLVHRRRGHVAGIFQEVDEEVRKEKATEWWKRYGVYLLSLAVAIVLGFAGFKAWQAYDLSQRGERSDAFASAAALSQSGDQEAALAAFAESAGVSGCS